MAARGQDDAGDRRRPPPLHPRGQDDRPALGRSVPRRRDLPDAGEELASRFPGVRFVRYDTFGSTHGRDEQRVLAELPAKLKALGVDAVISGMAC
jgi:hypothetical protein